MQSGDGDVIATLNSIRPDIDWADTMAAVTGVDVSEAEVEAALIDAGCDPELVHRTFS